MKIWKNRNMLPISGSRNKKREIIRKRDNHTCQNCGKIWLFGKRRFDVHHLDEDNSKTNKVDNLKTDSNNLITLCHKCHYGVHYGKINLFNIKQNTDNK